MQKRAETSSRYARLMSGAMFVLAPVVLGSLAASAEEISFTQDIKPILDTKCVSCHACYEAPGQLDLRSARGVERGAMKFQSYEPRNQSAESTVLWTSPKTLEEWRKQGFFSVTEGGADSIMAQLLKLGHENPVKANEQFPTNIVIDEITRKNYLPNKFEVDAYIAQHPQEGMPLAVNGLTDAEYETIMSWLAAGAPLDEKVIEPTAVDLEQIAKWEDFLNGTDNRSKLMARYIFEHSFQFTFFFEDKDDANPYQLVRSTTPVGQAPVPVSEFMANRPVEGDFYYRFAPLNQTQCVKVTRTQLLGDDAKLDRIKKIFSEEEWDVDVLPGYTDAERFDPLSTFAAIPPKIRWKYLLSDAWAFRSTIPHGPSCHGNLATSVVQEQAWEIFENPETSLYVNDAEYRAKVDPLLSMVANPDNVMQGVLALNQFVKHRFEAMELAAKRAEETGYKSKISDIWAGEEAGDTPLFVFFRHDDTAWSTKRNWAAGDYPRVAWVLDLPILEHAIYSSVVNFELFGTADDQLFTSREIFGMTRVAAEINFLRFLPEEKRLPIFRDLYSGELSEQKFKDAIPEWFPLPKATIPTAIEYKTDDPIREFFDQLFEYMGPAVDSADPINRPKPGDDADTVTKALQSIHAAGEQQEPTWRKFKTFLPEATFIRIDREGAEPRIYTMTRDRWYQSKAFISTELQNDIPSKTQVTVLEGVNSAYPNFIFRVDEAEIEEFAAALIDADTQDMFTAVVERWGVRRSNPNFWPILHSFTDYMKRTEPRGAGVFDINRYKNL